MVSKVLTAIAVTAALALLLAGMRDDKLMHDRMRAACIELSYTGAPATPADDYECARYGIALDNVPAYDY